MNWEKMSAYKRRQYMEAYAGLLAPLREKEEDKTMINQKKINAYMDLVNVIIKKTGDRWAIDSADSGPDSFSTDKELMEYINYELREIEAIYTANGELDDLREIYQENGLDLPSKEAQH